MEVHLKYHYYSTILRLHLYVNIIYLVYTMSANDIFYDSFNFIHTTNPFYGFLIGDDVIIQSNV